MHSYLNAKQYGITCRLPYEKELYIHDFFFHGNSWVYVVHSESINSKLLSIYRPSIHRPTKNDELYLFHHVISPIKAIYIDSIHYHVESINHEETHVYQYVAKINIDTRAAIRINKHVGFNCLFSETKSVKTRRKFIDFVNTSIDMFTIHDVVTS